jgi:hypothetical protein
MEGYFAKTTDELSSKERFDTLIHGIVFIDESIMELITALDKVAGGNSLSDDVDKALMKLSYSLTGVKMILGSCTKLD